MNNPSFDYLDFVLLGFSSAMVSKTVSYGSDETSDYRNKMQKSSLTQYRKRYPEMMPTGKFTWKGWSQSDRNRNRWTVTVLFMKGSNEFSSWHFQIDNSKAHAINQMISMIYGSVRDNNILKNTNRVDDETGELR